MPRRVLSFLPAVLLLLVGLTVLSAPAAQAAVSAPAVPTSAEPYLDYTKLFYRTSGWTGGDAHISVPLGGDRTLWLFGDSGTAPIGPDRWYTCSLCMERNSIAIQQGKNPATASLNYYFGPPEPGQTGQGAFFQPPEGDSDPGKNWFWPADGVRTSAGLYVFLNRAVSDPCCAWGKYVDTYLVHISNPDAPPAQWQKTYQRLPYEVFKGTEHFKWPSAVVEAGGYLYLYGTKDSWIGADMTLARARPENIADFYAWEFYDFTPGTWKSVPRGAPPGSVELTVGPWVSGLYSVHYQPSLNRYVAVYNVVGISQDVYARYSAGPTGPWSESHLVYRCAEGALDPRSACYHAQAHGELSTADNEVVLSYSTMESTNGDNKLGQLREASYGSPRFVRLRFPGDSGRVEGESLVPAATATAPVSAQTGGPWSGNGQLWLRARQPGEYVEVPFEVPRNGLYAMSLTQTTGPAYGKTLAAVDGQQLPSSDFDGFADAVSTETTEHEPVYLAKGKHLLRFTVTGKSASATGYQAGLDHVATRPVDARGPFRFEAETMRPPLAATAPVDVQNNNGWFFWWSGEGQLRVNATGAGQYAELALDVPVSGHYDLTAGQTEGDDYGVNSIKVDGQAVGPSFDAHHAGLTITPVSYGTVHLASGRHTLRVTVDGKNGASTGYRAGLDYIDLRPAHNTETGALLENPDDPAKPDDDWWFKPSAGTSVVAQRTGDGWTFSGGGQLQMQSTGAGQYVDMRLVAPATGFYDLSVAQTEGPGYGINTISVDGQPVGKPFDAYDPGKKVTDLRYGTVRLTSGTHWVRATVTGKNSSASGFHAGIDHFRLRPVAGATPTAKGPVGWDSYRHLDRLAEVPSGVEARAFSSFDRTGGNGDNNSCLRRTTAGECVLAEDDGAGELTSMWFTHAAGTLGDVTPIGRIKVELDEQTVLDAPLADVVAGRLPAPFKYPLVADRQKSAGGNYVMVPMPYRTRMRVTTQHTPGYYAVRYRRFADAAGVTTFDPGDQATDVLDRLRTAGTADPKPALPGARTTDTTVNLAPGGTARLAELTGPAEIGELKLRLPQVVGPQYQTPLTDDHRMLRDTTDDCADSPAACASYSEFTAAINPANQGVRLTRRANTSWYYDQTPKVFVDGTEVGRWTAPPPTTRDQFAEVSLELPASVTAGKSSIKIRTETQPMWYLWGFQEFVYWVDARVNGQWTRTDSLDVGKAAAEQSHAYRVVNQKGAGSITAPYPMTGDPAAVAASNDILGKTRLRITFDGVPTVDTPLGEFFGSGLGEFDVRSLMFAMDRDGSYTSWWPMPLQTKATIELVNGSGQQLTGVAASVTWAPSFNAVGLADGRLGLFRATSRQGALESGKDWTVLDVQGRGKLVGIAHSMRGDGNLVYPTGYLEGDERIHADGSAGPQIHGTGTEDFYLGGWYFNGGPFSNPFSGAPAEYDMNFGCQYRCTGAYRVHVADAVPFEGSLRFGIEHGPANDIGSAYGSTAFWYGASGTGLSRSDQLNIGNAGSESAHGYVPGAPVVSLTSRFDGDDDTEFTDDLRAETAERSFRMTIPADNHGVVLRRLSDQRRAVADGPDQAVRVYVDGLPVGIWRQPLSNNTRRWLEDGFLLPAAHTLGKGGITIKLEPLPGSAPWSAGRYDTYTR